MSLVPPDSDGRARLLSASFTLFSERGFDPVSVRAIAERADVTAGLVTHHFGSKDRLIAEVDAYALEQCAGVIEGAMAQLDEPHDQGAAFPIRGVQDSITQALSQQPVLREYIGRRIVSDADAGRQFFAQFVILVEAGLRRLREAGVVRGEIDHAGSMVTVTHLILGPIVLARQWSHLAGVDAFSPELIEPTARATHEILGHGLFNG